MSSENTGAEKTENSETNELKKNRYRDFTKNEIMNIADPEYYYKFTGQKFATQVLKESSEVLIVGLVASFLFELITAYKLNFNFLDSDYSTQFATLITLGIYFVTKYTRYEETDIFTQIYGEEYAYFRTLIEDRDTIESVEVLEKGLNLNPFAILGYILVNSRKFM